MRNYRRYRCDFGHQWEIEREQGEPEDPKDTHCGEGHEAVTRTDEEPADEVQVLIRPAARIIDKVTQKRGMEGRYWLVLLDRANIELLRSSAHYSWDEAVAIGKLFQGKGVSRALEWWERKRP